MTKHLTSSIYLNSVVDNLFNYCVSDTYYPSIKDCIITTTPDITGSYTYYDFGATNIDYIKKWTAPKIDIPSYPVSNIYLKQDGTMVLELAVTGFSKEEITGKVEGDKLCIKGKKIEDTKKDEKETYKYVHKKISMQDFDITYQCNDKMDLENIELTIDKGILTVSIPLKENEKPVIKELKIK